VARARFENDRLSDVQDIFVAESRGRGHYGSRLAFDRAGFLYITVGDRQASPSGDLASHPSQDRSNHAGTINRIHDDGRVPSDNPFVGEAGMRPEIWSYGHRNPQGMMIHPETGELWATEHGPQGGDELNWIQKGRNYGWPVVGYGVNYGSGATIHATTIKEGMEQPVRVWVPSIATTGVMVYTGDKFPGWKGSVFVGGMAGQQLARLTLEGHGVTNEETLQRGKGRIRDVKQGPDGFIYLAIDGPNPTPILRLEPAGR
jgi:glucose/arabinose dehydrogenase